MKAAYTDTKPLSEIKVRRTPDSLGRTVEIRTLALGDEKERTVKILLETGNYRIFMDETEIDSTKTEYDAFRAVQNIVLDILLGARM